MSERLGLLFAKPRASSPVSPAGNLDLPDVASYAGALLQPVEPLLDYTQDSGEKLYRRSLYTFWKRSAPPASMDIFNAPTREIATVRRVRTNTPLQALVTMNDPQFVEASRYLVQKAMREAGDEFDRRLDYVTTPERPNASC